MTISAPSTETIHASCVAIDGQAVLLSGRSGSGKSDLALRLIDRGAKLVSDDYTVLRRTGDTLTASAPPSIAGGIEVRGIGIVAMQALAEAPVAMIVLLDEPVERMPDEERGHRMIAGARLRALALNGLEASAPIKVELALRQAGESR